MNNDHPSRLKIFHFIFQTRLMDHYHHLNVYTFIEEEHFVTSSPRLISPCSCLGILVNISLSLSLIRYGSVTQITGV